LNNLYSDLDITGVKKKALEALIRVARTHLSSTTVKSLSTDTKYIIDGFITTTGKASLYYAFLDGKPLCVKIMGVSDSPQEITISKIIGQNPWIVNVIDTFKICDDLMAIVMPVYHKSAEDLVKIWRTKEAFNAPPQAIVDIFFSILSGLLHLASKNICHSDIKTENLMMRNDGLAIMIDLGAAVQYGEEVFEYSLKESLDVIETSKHKIFQTAGIHVDLLCTATTIVKLGSGKIGSKKKVGFVARVKEYLKKKRSINCLLFCQSLPRCSARI